MNPWSFLAQFYYTESLMVVTGIIAFFISAKNYRRHKELRIFCYLLFLDLTQIATVFYQYMRQDELLRVRIMLLTTLAFLLFEYIVFTRFIYSQLVSRKRRLIVAGLPVFFVVELVLLIKFATSLKQVYQFSLVDCIALTVPCFLYFYELFLYPSGRPLKADPVFWVITGMLFLKCVSIPLYLIYGMKYEDTYKASSLNFFLYAVYFCMLIRAYLCAPRTSADTAREIHPTRLRGRGNIESIK